MKKKIAKKSVGPDSRKIVDAIDSGKTSDLPEDWQGFAKFWEQNVRKPQRTLKPQVEAMNRLALQIESAGKKK